MSNVTHAEMEAWAETMPREQWNLGPDGWFHLISADGMEGYSCRTKEACDHVDAKRAEGGRWLIDRV